MKAVTYRVYQSGTRGTPRYVDQNEPHGMPCHVDQNEPRINAAEARGAQA